jgi:hypothetical protein
LEFAVCCLEWEHPLIAIVSVSVSKAALAALPPGVMRPIATAALSVELKLFILVTSAACAVSLCNRRCVASGRCVDFVGLKSKLVRQPVSGGTRLWGWGHSGGFGDFVIGLFRDFKSRNGQQSGLVRRTSLHGRLIMEKEQTPPSLASFSQRHID